MNKLFCITIKYLGYMLDIKLPKQGVSNFISKMFKMPFYPECYLKNGYAMEMFHYLLADKLN